MGADRRDRRVMLPAPLQEIQERGPVLLIFLRHFG
jgi:hypothetical protein